MDSSERDSDCGICGSLTQSLVGTDSRAVLPAAVLGDQLPVFWDSRAQWTTHGSTRLWVKGEPPIRKAS